MTPYDLHSLSTALRELAPAIANHLWQSTAFAALAGLLTLALRANHARTRHTIWMAATLKFLLPFALLSGLATHFARPNVAAPQTPAIYYAVDDFSEPFAPPVASTAATAVPVVVRERVHPGEWLPVAAAVVWLVGFLTMLSLWSVRWLLLARAIRNSGTVENGREIEALRALEALGNLHTPLRLVVVKSAMEPGIFGIFRPVLVWPVGISERLNDAHLEAILAHEICHVRRRDNLLAAFHMFVAAAFWFHPLVWWMSKQLIAERERACDEAVLELCARPHVYAESILKVCEFCVESPLECVAGVTGADLKRRIVEIMRARTMLRLTWGKRLLIAVAAVFAFVIPMVMVQAKASQRMAKAMLKAAPAPLRAGLRTAAHAMIAEEQTPSSGVIPVSADTPATSYTPTMTYDVASIRETHPVEAHFVGDVGGPPPLHSGRLNVSNMSMMVLLMRAYNMTPDRMQGLPDWARRATYDIQATVDPAVDEKLAKLTDAQAKLEKQHMMQVLLAERFGLKAHMETNDGPVLDLTVGSGGPKFHGAKPPAGDSAPKKPQMDQGSDVDGLIYFASNLDMPTFASWLTAVLHKPVRDKTGLTGGYDFELHYTVPPKGSGGESAQYALRSPPLEAAIQEDLGLKLVSTHGPVPTLVVEHVDRPTVDGAEVQQSAASLRYVAMMQQPVSIQGTALAGTVKGLEFEVATVKPSSQSKDWGMGMDVLPDGLVKLTNVPAYSLVEYAYGVPYQSPRMSGGPEWVHAERYDIEAKAPEGALPSSLTTKERNGRVRVMMQALLAERFKLSIQRQVKDVPVYNLVVGKGGPKLQPSKVTESDCAAGINSGEMRCHQLNGGQGRGLHGTAVNMTDIVKFVESWSDRPMIDQTGLTGLYAVDTEGWVSMRQTAPRDTNSPSGDEGLSDPLRPTLFSVFQGLGLKLEPSTGPTEVYEIDHMERPSAN